MKRVFCCFAAVLALALVRPVEAQSFSFSTLAGSAGQEGSVDGTNGAARFGRPGGVAVDLAGNVYVADTMHHTIRQIRHLGSSWVVRTLAGSPGASGTADGSNSDARFNFPYGLAVDNAGTIYVADTYNHAIRRIDPVGTNWMVTTLAGTPGSPGESDGPGSYASFRFPYGVAVDGFGYVYVADTYNQTIRQIAPGGYVTTLVGAAGTNGIANGTNSSARFNYPSGVAVDAAGTVYVADTYNSLIRQVRLLGSDWVASTVAGIPKFPGSADGTNYQAQFSYPFGVAVDASGDLLVADTSYDTIRRITPMGTNWVVSTVGGVPDRSGSADGPDGSARFDDPYSVAVDTMGNLYVADTKNDTIRFGEPGVLLLIARQPGQVVLSWPATAGNYLLETRASFAPGATWSPITTGVVSSGGYFFKTNAVGPGAAFFRLHKTN